jgi:hypothetical protein
MAWTRVQTFSQTAQYTSTAVNNTQVTPGSAFTVGDVVTLITTVSADPTTLAPTVTDSLGNTYNRLSVAQGGQQFDSGNAQGSDCWWSVITVPGTPTITYDPDPVNNPWIAIQGQHHSGGDASTIRRDSKGANQVNPGTGADAIATASVAAQSGDLLVGFSGDPGNATTTEVAGTGFAASTVNAAGLMSEWKAATGAQTVTFTDATNGGGKTYLSYGMAFSPAVGGIGGGSYGTRGRPGVGPRDRRGFLKRRYWDYTLAAVVAGTIFNADVSESLAAADSQTAQADFAAAISESGSAVDTQTGTVVFSSAVSESGSAADSQTGLRAFSSAISEAVTVADTETGTVTFSASITEAGTVADSQTGLGVFASTRTEALTAADTETGLAIFSSAVSESLTAADNETVQATFIVAEAETLSATDSQDGNVGANTYTVTITESLSSSDSEIATALFAVARAEPLAAAESIAGQATMGVAVTEPLSAQDSSTGTLPSGITLAVVQNPGTDLIVAGSSSNSGITQNTGTSGISSANSQTISINSQNNATISITPAE